MWDFLSFLVGGMVGLTIGFLLLLIFYNTRTLVFVGIPRQRVTCRASQYYENPTSAIDNGASVDDILFLNDRNQMYYHRVPKDLCMPGSNQAVRVIPQYCLFKDSTGKTIEAKNNEFESPYYTSVDQYNGEYINIIARPTCNPQYNSAGLDLVSGVPELKWDASISD